MLKILGKRWLVTLLAVVLIALVIWFGGPYLALGEFKPFESVVGRLVGILVLLALWAAWLQISQLRSARASDRLGDAIAVQAGTGAAAGRAQAGGEGEVLRRRFEEAIKTLKSGRRGRDLYAMPWYVIIGPPGSGKTTALVHSGLKFPLAQKFGAGALQGVGGTRNCDWWFTDEAVLLDTAGRYLSQDSDAAADGQAWGAFLALLRKHRGRRPINGVLVAISVTDLLSGDPGVMGRHVAAVRHRLDELSRHLRVRVPVYLLVTKADLIAGFSEYFDDLSADERRQVWGVTFPIAESEGGRAPARVGTDLDALAVRLEERRLERLAAETDPRRRAAILAFPAQFRGLADALRAFVNDAFSASAFDAPVLLRGVYLTSGTQESTPIDRAIGAVARMFGLGAEVAPRPSPASGRAYFIELLLREVVFREAGLAGVNRRAEARLLALQVAGYVACAALVGLMLAGFIVSYGRNASYLGEVAAAVARYKQTPAPPAGVSGARLVDALPRLQAARDVATTANQYADSTPLLMRFGLYRGRPVGEAATDAYLRELSGSLLPALGERLEAGVAGSTAEPDRMFEYLKAYLMLGDLKHLDAAHLAAVARLEWARLLPQQRADRLELEEHTAQMLREPERLTALTVDRDLVARAQAALATASLPVLMYSRLKLSYAGDTEHAVRFDKNQGADKLLVRRSGAPLGEPLSALYTRKAFDDFQSTGRTKLNEQFLADSWVLGAAAPTLLQMRGVSDQVAKIYEDDYIQAWDGVLKDIAIRKPAAGNTAELLQLLRMLGSPASPLKAYLDIVNRQTNFSIPAPDAAGKPAAVAALEARAASVDKLLSGASTPAEPPGTRITQHFESYHALLAGSPPPIDRVLQGVAKAADELAAPPAGGSAAGRAGQAGVLDNLKAEAPLLPPALADMILDVSKASEQSVSQLVRADLSQSYQEQVVRSCVQAIKNRYPFEPGGSVEVTLDDFGRLFGPNGIYDSFFKENLAGLIDNGKSPWRWRETAGAAAVPGLPAQFEAAKRLQEVFFRPGGAQPEVRFNVTALELDANADEFLLRIDGREFRYAHGPILPKDMQWPGSASGDASYQFRPPTSAPAYSGPWAMFRLLQQVHLKAQSDVRFVATFGTSPSARVQIDAGSVRNPFSHPEVLRFRCGG